MAETDRSIDRSYLDNRSVSRLSGRAWKNKFSKVSYVATFTYVRPRIFIFNRVKSSKDGERERETAEERERRDGFGVFKDGGALFTAVSSAGIRGYFGASLPEPRRGGRERWTARHDAAHGETESNSRPAGAVLSAPAASCHCHQQYAPYTSSPLFRLPSSPTSAPMPVLVIPIPILRRHDFYHQPIITIVDNNLICVEYFL